MKKVKLGEICEIVTGSTPKSSNPNYWNGEYKWITPAEISDDDFIVFDTQRKITKLGIEETGLKSFPTGTVLLSSRAPIGKVAISGCEMYCNQGFKNFICSNKINNEYLYYFFKARKNYLNILGRGATFKEISKSIVSDIEIFLPTYDIQRKQVKVLKKIDKLIYTRKEQLIEFEYLVKSRFNEMFEEYPDSVFLDTYIKELRAGKSLAGEENNKNKVLKTGAVSYDYFNSSEVKNLPIDYIPLDEHKVEIGDVIISRMNTSELVGAAGYVWAINSDNIYLPDRLWKVILNDRVNPVFLWKLITNEKTKLKIKRIASGTSGSMKNISKSKFLQIRVPLPPLSLQNEFADFVAQVDKSQLAIQKSLEELETLKKSLMQEYFG
ncbi:restriction endonuclease subunit S [Streptococcus mitis]|uniref:restriction endonuclease subunit S n=1 Tax=Streptococcus mitis TaxID=28037 RepID=UPI001C4F9224